MSRARTMRFLQRRFFFIPQLVALFIASPIAWMAFDRTPPLVLYDGKIVPSTVSPYQTDVKVSWKAKFSGRDCPGDSQRELIDSQKNVWPKRARDRRGVFIPEFKKPLIGEVSTPTLAIPDMAPGPAIYRVTQFYYCNWLQRVLDWPIIQQSPPVYFNVAP